ncbi:MAG: hypothetical protein QOG53_2297 [Frankiales bacterium]|nr:hypothetical protein [Frankiales bacterium]
MFTASHSQRHGRFGTRSTPGDVVKQLTCTNSVNYTLKRNVDRRFSLLTVDGQHCAVVALSCDATVPTVAETCRRLPVLIGVTRNGTGPTKINFADSTREPAVTPRDITEGD